MLVLGGGGREHAIVQSLAISTAVGMVFVSPGNSGTAMMGHCIATASSAAVMNVPAMSVTDTMAFAQSCGVDLVVVGPEQPLVEGIADALQEQVCTVLIIGAFLLTITGCDCLHVIQDIPCFGPSAAASKIEASKIWAKDFMRRHGVPTAESCAFTEAAAAEAYILQQPHAVVVKVGPPCCSDVTTKTN